MMRSWSVVDLETAELIKYAANAFLATKIAFINEMADVAEAVGADIEGVCARDGFGSTHWCPASCNQGRAMAVHAFQRTPRPWR